MDKNTLYYGDNLEVLREHVGPAHPPRRRLGLAAFSYTPGSRGVGVHGSTILNDVPVKPRSLPS
jgi:hypothetical protein